MRTSTMLRNSAPNGPNINASSFVFRMVLFGARNFLKWWWFYWRGDPGRGVESSGEEVIGIRRRVLNSFVGQL